MSGPSVVVLRYPVGRAVPSRRKPLVLGAQVLWGADAVVVVVLRALADWVDWLSWAMPPLPSCCFTGSVPLMWVSVGNTRYQEADTNVPLQESFVQRCHCLHIPPVRSQLALAFARTVVAHHLFSFLSMPSLVVREAPGEGGLLVP